MKKREPACNNPSCVYFTHLDYVYSYWRQKQMYTQYFLKYLYSYSSAKVKDTNITIRYRRCSTFCWILVAFVGICLVIMASIVSQIVVVLVNREISAGSVNWPRVRRRYYLLYPVFGLIRRLKQTCVPKSVSSSSVWWMVWGWGIKQNLNKISVGINPKTNWYKIGVFLNTKNEAWAKQSGQGI